MRTFSDSAKYIKKGFYLAVLFFYFCYKILESGFIVGGLIIKGYRGDYGHLLEYKVKNNNRWNILLFFNMVSMTPGSLSVDLLDDGQTISVHLLHEKDTREFYETAGRLEKLLNKVFEPKKYIP
jgi:multicomponent Na+:H+ antiporter subunit E